MISIGKSAFHTSKQESAYLAPLVAGKRQVGDPNLPSLKGRVD
jgi:hypothetical protein